MKISKTGSLLLAIGIPVILLGSLGTVRSQQVQEQTGLYQELTLVKQRLSKIQFEQPSSKKEDLETQLSRTVSQLEDAKAMLDKPIGSIGVNDVLFGIAEACDVEVAEVNSSGLVGGDLEGIACSTLMITVRAKGDMHNLLSFITKLNDDFTTGLVKSVEIRFPRTLSEQKPSANIRLVIYTCRGE